MIQELSLFLCTEDAVLPKSFERVASVGAKHGWNLGMCRFFVLQPQPLSVGWEEGTLALLPLSPAPSLGTMMLHTEPAFDL